MKKIAGMEAEDIANAKFKFKNGLVKTQGKGSLLLNPLLSPNKPGKFAI
jgi:hypothetical protein